MERSEPERGGSMSLEKLLQKNGAYSLPFLVKISNHGDTESIRIVNDVNDVVYQGQTYTASTFEFTPNIDVLGLDGGGRLSITVVDNNLIELIESNYNLKIEVLGILLDNEVTPLENFRSLYGSVTWDGLTAEFDFEPDDRMNMTFPALIFNHYNNRGNM
jgi:hypothetical protein